METIEDLLISDYKIYQDDGLYRFTSDAILLSRFVTAKAGETVADFCAGSGIVGLNFYALNEKNVKSVTLIELQKPLSDLSLKTVKLNGLDDRFTVINDYVQTAAEGLKNKFSLVLCNPPFIKKGTGYGKESDDISICKKEITVTFAEIALAAAKTLKNGGRFAVVHRADRIADVLTEMKNHGIEPKRLQFVAPKNKPPYLMLCEGVKGGKSGLKILQTAVN